MTDKKAARVLRVVTVNVNGIRSATKKGFFDWLAQHDADVVCLQEVRAGADILAQPAFRPAGWHIRHSIAETKKGYSGVAVFTRHAPDAWQETIGHPVLDAEGRYIAARVCGVWVHSLYLPSGTSGDARQAVKYDTLDYMTTRFAAWGESDEKHIVCGDYNIAHTKDDIKNWRGNQKNSGFLPEERAWFDHVLHTMDWHDAFRQLPQAPEQYTWWSNRGNARANNTGWRIDYQVIHPMMKNSVVRTAIAREPKLSDHAPFSVDYRI